ncbi:MAG: hypothetical protein JWR68_1381 [Polaromonas sp.]|nr:hypothetical protein [Polaromonas sp.]
MKSRTSDEDKRLKKSKQLVEMLKTQTEHERKQLVKTLMRKSKLELAEQLAASIWAETRPPGLIGVVNGVQLISADTGQLVNERRPEVLHGLLRHSHDMTDILTEKIEEAPKHFAQSGGKANADRYKPIEDYALKLYGEKTWKSISQARREIWPKVKVEAKRLGRPMSEETGPETLYKWLLKCQKSKRLLDDA